MATAFGLAREPASHLKIESAHLSLQSNDPELRPKIWLTLSLDLAMKIGLQSEFDLAPWIDFEPKLELESKLELQSVFDLVPRIELKTKFELNS